MIDYYAAYSPYSMLLTTFTIVCIVLGAYLSAYGITKIGLNFLLIMLIIALLGLLCVAVTGFLALVSPTIKLQNMFFGLRRVIALFTTVPLLYILFNIYYKGYNLKQCGLFSVFFLVHSICVFYLFENRSGILLDFLSILDFGIYSIILIFLRGSLFVELSPVSIDNFMQELDDIVLIFEKDKKLIDTNKKARETFPFLHDGLMINEFLKKLKIMTISKKPVGQNEEIALSLPNGIRYYQFDKTQVKDKKGNSQATVLIFHDITEESLLEKELACKNAEVAKLNIRLKAFLDTAEKLIEEEQKAKAEKEIKEMLGIKIKNLLSDIELISHNSEYEKLPGLIEDCRDLMAGVRLALQKLIKKAGEDEIDD